MLLCNVFTSAKSYRDVVQMIYTLDAQVSKNIIIGKDLSEVPSSLISTVAISPGRYITGLSYWWWAAKEIEKIAMNMEPFQKCIVVEHVVGVSCTILKLKGMRKVKKASFLVFPTLEFLFKRGWNVDKWALPLNKEQEIAYLLEFIKRAVLELITLWSADAILANSPAIIQWSKRITNKPDYFLFPNSVEPVVNAERKFGEEKRSAFNILFVANMQPHKGVATALEIFTRFIEQGGKGHLSLIGPIHPRDREWFMRLLTRYSKRLASELIKYHGYVPFHDLWRHYVEADVILFPTYFEGSPRVVQEALLYGTPVIVSDLPGTRLIDPSGNTLMFFVAGDLDGALQHLWRCYEDPQWRRSLGHKGIQLMREHFSAARVGAELLRICREISRTGYI